MYIHSLYDNLYVYDITLLAPYSRFDVRTNEYIYIYTYIYRWYIYRRHETNERNFWLFAYYARALATLYRLWRKGERRTKKSGGERVAEGRQRAVGQTVRRREREGETVSWGRRRKKGDTTEETFQMCYRLLNKFRVKLPDLVSTAVAPAGRKWRIKAANLPVFIRLFARSSLRCTATLPSPPLPPPPSPCP